MSECGVRSAECGVPPPVFAVARVDDLRLSIGRCEGIGTEPPSLLRKGRGPGCAAVELRPRSTPALAFSLSPSEGERAGERGPLAPDLFSLSPSEEERAGERGPLAPDLLNSTAV